MEEGDHLTMLNVYEAFIKVSTVAATKAPSMLPSIGGSLLFSRLFVSSVLRPCGLQHARLPCPSLSPAVLLLLLLSRFSRVRLCATL